MATGEFDARRIYGTGPERLKSEVQRAPAQKWRYNPHMAVRVELISGVDAVSALEWDQLTGDDDPFVEHAFLHALEVSRSVGRGTGWHPTHVIARDEHGLLGALPLYAKQHSYGEYIFDFGWARAAERAGIAYYPKLVAMVPLTPATGRRILHRPGADLGAVTR